MFIGSTEVVNEAQAAEAYAQRIARKLREKPSTTWQHEAYLEGIYPGSRLYKRLSWMFV